MHADDPRLPASTQKVAKPEGQRGQRPVRLVAVTFRNILPPEIVLQKYPRQRLYPPDAVGTRDINVARDGVNVVEDKITLLRSPNSNNVGAPHAPSRRAKPPGKLISHQTDLQGVAEACEREHRGGHRAHAARCAWGWPGDHSAAAVSSAAVARHTPRPRCASPAFGR